MNYDLIITEVDGDLHLHPAQKQGGAQAFAELVEERGEDLALADALESYRANGSFTPFDAGDGNPFVGLTSAPCIAEEMDVHDDGTHEIVGRFWYRPDYMLRSAVDELDSNGYIYYKLGGLGENHV